MVATNTPTTTPKHDHVVFDVGMHRGEDTDYYLKKGFCVVAFEADPGLVDHCRSRFSDALHSGRLVIVEGAIVSSHQLRSRKPTIDFYRNLDTSEWGTLCESWASRNAKLGTRSEIIEVQAVDFRDHLLRHGIPHYMKIDIEGSDQLCLDALLEFGPKPDYVSIESEKRTFAELKAEMANLERLGYNMFKAVDQGRITCQEQPKPAQEGVYVPNHVFTPGSSGLFGRELPGEWKNTKQLLNGYRRIFGLYHLSGDYSITARSRIGRGAIRRLVTAALRGRPIVRWYDTHAKHSSVPD
jgi:FkbM family methyltransferase